MITNEGLLYIEPSGWTSPEPVIDELTCKMAAAFRQATVTSTYRGWHTCACGARSSSCDYALLNGLETNSLCVHYLAYHRDEVPAVQLERVAALDIEPIEPTEHELYGPHRGRPEGLGGITTSLRSHGYIP